MSLTLNKYINSLNVIVLSLKQFKLKLLLLREKQLIEKKILSYISKPLRR